MAEFTSSIDSDRSLPLTNILPVRSLTSHGLGRRACSRRTRSRRWSADSKACGDVEAGTLIWDPALEDCPHRISRLHFAT